MKARVFIPIVLSSNVQNSAIVYSYNVLNITTIITLFKLVLTHNFKMYFTSFKFWSVKWNICVEYIFEVFQILQEWFCLWYSGNTSDNYIMSSKKVRTPILVSYHKYIFSMQLNKLVNVKNIFKKLIITIIIIIKYKDIWEIVVLFSHIILKSRSKYYGYLII